jgi:hypothetical protein
MHGPEPKRIPANTGSDVVQKHIDLGDRILTPHIHKHGYMRAPRVRTLGMGASRGEMFGFVVLIIFRWLTVLGSRCYDLRAFGISFTLSLADVAPTPLPRVGVPSLTRARLSRYPSYSCAQSQYECLAITTDK